MNKEALRHTMINLRKSIPNKKELSTMIGEKVMNLDIFKKSRVIALYHSLPDEVDTKLFLEKGYDKKFLLPKIDGDKMFFVEVKKNTLYTKDKLGVMEPLGPKYLGRIDLIIVPGVSFDKKLNRLGFGKGYYDKYLAKRDLFKIGLCFDEQIVKVLPTDSFDIKMDMVISEKRVLKKV